jgi:hypothetical protein
MSDAIMNSATEMSVLVPSVWSERFYDVLLSDNAFNAVVSRDYEGSISAMGDTVKISQFPEFDDAIELDESAKSDADAITVTQQSLVINKQIVKDFIVTNKALLQSLPAMDKLKELAVYSINKKIQALIIAATIPSASAPDHQISYDATTTLALADILEAKELLDNQNCPMADRHFCVGASQLNDLFNISALTSSDYVAGSGIINQGTMDQMILGFMPHFTSVVGNTSYFFHKSYLTVAVQKGMEVTQYDLGVEGKRAQRVNCGVLMGLKLLDSKRVVSIA